MASSDLDQDAFLLFRYTPSLAAAVIFALIFAAFALLHTYQVLVTRTWFFIAFLFGCYFEVIGFAVRGVCAQQSPDWTVPAYSTHTILVLVAPSVFAASIYMILGRIVLLTDGEAYSPIRRIWLTKIFVIGDVVSFIMQGAGGGIMASGDSLDTLHLGENVIIVGLVVQIAFFTCFLIIAGLFHHRMAQLPTRKALAEDLPWAKHLCVLYAGGALIWVRCVFRIIEYAQGNDGYLISHEVYLYIFDASLMVLVIVLFAIWHPSEVTALIARRGAKKIEMGIKLESVY